MVRLSALGDVAILEPVVRQRAAQNPDVEFLLAAPPMLQPLFDGIPNLVYIPTKKDSSWRLYRQLKSFSPTVLADVHGVWRTWGLRLLFAFGGTRSCGIDKQRHSRKALLRAKGKDLSGLKPSWQRYDEVLTRAGCSGETRLLPARKTSRGTDCIRVGIAPFAQHKGKIYPLERMEQVVALLSQRGNVEVLLFGSKGESSILEGWAGKYPRVKSVAGKLKFGEELSLIEGLDVMVSMDSANMHFASCKGVRVVSVWGATHPAAGFYGFGQDADDAVMADLPCRPCSMFGKKPCRWGDYRCLAAIAPESIVAKIL